METVKNHFFQYHHILQIWKLLKSVISKPPHPPNMETVENQLFQDHHILQIWKLLKISYFRTTTPTKSRNCYKSLLSRPPHQPKSRNCYKSAISRPLQPPKIETVKNHFFQDHHILQIWKLLKISYFKTTTSSQNRKC